MPEEICDRLRRIKLLLDKVCPRSLQKWEDMLCREQEPGHELGLWVHIAEAYGRITQGASWAPAQEKEILRVLILCSMNGREQALRTVEVSAISREEAAEVVRRYFDGV
jgi:hypothetical protein